MATTKKKVARKKKALPEALKKHQFKKGESGRTRKKSKATTKAKKSKATKAGIHVKITQGGKTRHLHL